MGDLQLNYRIEGSGRPLLLVHGFGISFNIWKNLLPVLRSHFTLVMVELPGIGRSAMPSGERDYLHASVEALQRLRRTLEIESWPVLGYSTGSRIAEAYVQACSEHVRYAVFLCPLKLDIFKVVSLRLALWMDGFVPALGSWVLRGWRLRFLIALFGFNLQPDPHTDEWYAEISALPVRVLKATLQMVSSFGMKPFSVPTGFSMIWGDHDIVPATPRRPEPGDHFVHANHAAPVVAAREVAATLLSILESPLD